MLSSKLTLYLNAQNILFLSFLSLQPFFSLSPPLSCFLASSCCYVHPLFSHSCLSILPSRPRCANSRLWGWGVDGLSKHPPAPPPPPPQSTPAAPSLRVLRRAYSPRYEAGWDTQEIMLPGSQALVLYQIQCPSSNLLILSMSVSCWIPITLLYMRQSCNIPLLMVNDVLCVKALCILLLTLRYKHECLLCSAEALCMLAEVIPDCLSSPDDL